MLPESSQSISINLAFCSDYLDVKEIREFGLRIKDYFKLSPGFLSMAANNVLVDPELKRHCEAVKYQKASMKDLAEYYVSYMDRMGKEADPKVKAKLAAKEYSDSIQQMNMGYGNFAGNPQGNFPGHGPGFGGMPGFPQPPGGPGMGGQGGFNMGGQGGFNMGGQGGYGAPPTGGNPFGNAPTGGHSFGGAGGFNMGGGPGFTTPAPQGNNFGGYNAMGGGNQGNNPFATGPSHNAQGGFNAGYQMGTPHYPQTTSSQNPFAQQPQPQYAKQTPPIDTMNLNMNPSPYNPPAPIQGQDPSKQFDDIFGDPKVPAQNPAFGGDKKPSTTVDTTDDFLKQLEDLKKL